MTVGIVSGYVLGMTNLPGFVALVIGLTLRNNMDIVYLVKDCVTDQELTYSMRSLINIPHDKVFIVGGCPTNINKKRVFHIPALQRLNKYQNTTTNLRLICENKSLSDNFILMNDDFYILKPIVDPETELNLCRGTIKDVLSDYERRYKTTNDYISGMKQTMIFLQDRGILNPLSYELHIPFVMNKNKVKEMFQLPYINSLKVIHKRSIYGNLYKTNSQPILDVKILNSHYTPIGSDKFLSTEDASFNRVKEYLNYLFPNKSEYEL